LRLKQEFKILVGTKGFSSEQQAWPDSEHRGT